MPITNINVHLGPDDPITLTARRGKVAQWVTLGLGATEVTIFAADDNAERLLDHLAQEITVALMALATEDPQ